MQRLLILLIAPILLAACATPAPTTAELAAKDDSLYQALGQQQGIDLLAGELVFRFISDTRIAHYFADTDLDRLEQKIAEQVCMLAGGPCTYTGDDMRTVHEGMNLTETDFNAMVEDAQLAMTAISIPEAAQNRLLAKLAKFRGVVLGREE
ncbi:MAG: group 1 truncated hemoglobin [Gammaproteobacteria bacterium]|nr:group 1 truncated hemoglobin [Gammaproteobacteria bacterium]